MIYNISCKGNILNFDLVKVFYEVCVMDKIFTPESKVNCACFVLYVERLNPDYKRLLDDSGFDYVLSPLHSPEGKKQHRHLLLRNSKHNLSYKKVIALVSSLNPEPANGIECGKTIDDVRKIVAYFAHRTPDSANKEQFSD